MRPTDHSSPTVIEITAFGKHDLYWKDVPRTISLVLTVDLVGPRKHVVCDLETVKRGPEPPRWQREGKTAE